MKEIDRRKIDVLHLHGYGATTFGRLAAKFTRLPVVLHEHANLTSTPWFQQVADRLLAGDHRHRPRGLGFDRRLRPRARARWPPIA